MTDTSRDTGSQFRSPTAGLPWPAISAAVFLAYFITGMIGIRLTVDPGIATLVWPPAGIAIAAALLFGTRRALPAVFAAHLALALAQRGSTDGTAADIARLLLATGGLGANACLQAWISATLARRYAGFPHRLTNPLKTVKFLALTGPIGCVTGAILGPTILVAAGYAPTADWANSIFAWWAGSTIGVIFFAPIVILLFLGPGNGSVFRQYFVPAMLFVAFLVMAAVHLHFGERSRDHILDHFGREASDLAATYRGTIDEQFNVLRSIDVTRHAIGSMPPSSFRAFARLYFDLRPDLLALSWNRLYGAGQLREVEARLRDIYGSSIPLTQRNPDGTIGGIETRSEYVTIMMTEWRGGAREALGFDLMSQRNYASAIARARKSGSVTATGRIPLGSGNNRHKGVLVFWPHFADGPDPRDVKARGRTLAGFHTALFRVGDGIDRLRSGRAGQNFSFRLTDLSAEGSESILQAGTNGSDLSAKTREAATWSYPVKFADRTWELRISLKPDALQAALVGQRTAMILPGVLIACLVVYLLLMASSRSSELTGLVREKTRELGDANRRQANLLRKYTETETRLEAAQRIARFGSWEWDISTDEIVAFSAECARIYGLRPVGDGAPFSRIDDLFERIHPDDRGIAEHRMRAYVALTASSSESPRPLEIEYRIVRPDGETGHLSQIVEPHFDGEIGRRLLLGTVRDVTQQRHAAELLRQSEDRLRQATQLAGLGHFVRDTQNHTFQFCSREYAQIFGLSVAEYLERAANETDRLSLIHPDDRENYVEARKNLRSGRHLTLAYRVLTATGETRHMREMIRPVVDAAGVVVQEVGVGQDMTAFELSEELLRQSHKMEALGKLTGGVAHDFNNLLFVVKGNADLLSRKLGGSDPLVAEILTAADRAEELTHQLLAFSRRQPLNPKPVDLNGMLARMSNLLRLTLGEAIDLQISCPADIDRVMIDRTQMENALLNIAINARDAMPTGGSLAIRCTNLHLGPTEAKGFDVPPGLYVLLEMADDGTGMSAETRQRAFEPFFTTKGVGVGSGLGLSMVYGFARQSGGTATIVSEEGLGATISLILPRAEENGAAESVAVEEIPQGNGEIVLLVEDDPSVSAVTQSMLTALGYRVVSAEQGREALELLATTQIDVILSDVALPGGMSGPEFVRRALESVPGLAVVFFSGYPDEVIRAEGPLDGNAPLLRKPVSRAALGRTLRDILMNARKNAAGSAPGGA